jgi:hypothetical protein
MSSLMQLNEVSQLRGVGALGPKTAKMFWSTNKASCMLISRRGDNAHRQKQ